MATKVDSVRVASAARRYAEERADVLLERLEQLVNVDSGPDSPDGRRRVAELLTKWAREAGLEVDQVETEAGDHVTLRAVGEGEGRVVLLGHHDTVFPAGTAAARPFRVVGGRAYGPGVADMKAGLLAGLTALEAMASHPVGLRSVELHSVPDEEVRTAAFVTLDHLEGASAVLVLECGRENGDLVTARKTGAWVTVRVSGRSAHAGTDPEEGRSAILGLCREILRCDRLNGARPGLSVSAGTIAGGTIANVVPASAEAVLDLRAGSSRDLQWALRKLAETEGGDGMSVDVRPVGVWPGIEPNPATEALFQEARRVHSALGETIGGRTSGGMSDGCWTAAAGLPTLDGLGPVGGLDHTPDEYVELGSVPLRCGLIAGLCWAVGHGVLDAVTIAGGG